MDTEMTRYESFAEVTEDFYCSAVDVLKILVLRLHDYHARCFHSCLLYTSQDAFTGRNTLIVHGFCHQGGKGGGQFIGLLPAHADG